MQARNYSRRLGVIVPQRGILLLEPQTVAPQARFIHASRCLFSEIIEVHGPAFAESISEGDIRWIKQKGDYVKEDELVAEIETDTTSVEVPAQFVSFNRLVKASNLLSFRLVLLLNCSSKMVLVLQLNRSCINWKKVVKLQLVPKLQQK